MEHQFDGPFAIERIVPGNAGTQLLVYDRRISQYRVVTIAADGWMVQEDGKRYSREHNYYNFFVIL